MPSAAILLRTARIRAELSQRELARRAETAQSVIARIESGTTSPSWQTLSKLLAATGHEVGTSLREPDKEDDARAILRAAKEREIDLILPSDVVCAPSLDARSGTVHDVERLPADQSIVDVGPRTLEEYERAIRGAKTIFWNGPVGVFESEPFAVGTRRVAQLLAASGATTVVGGGESVQAVQQAGLAKRMTHLSTGGGAALELIEGKILPGVAAIPA